MSKILENAGRYRARQQGVEMKIWLCTDNVRTTYAMVARGQADGDAVRWFVCVECAWISVAYRPPTLAEHFRDELPLCPRPRNDLHADTIARTVGALSGKKFGDPCAGEQTAWLDVVSPKIAAACDAAMRIGGTNAVIEILEHLQPIHVGAVERMPRVFRARADLETLRPDSVLPRRKKP